MLSIVLFLLLDRHYLLPKTEVTKTLKGKSSLTLKLNTSEQRTHHRFSGFGG
jgi:hypothetical protein